MPNRLAGETSPYLKQHADNPVDWYPWGMEALARAKLEDKPILLSIGYSACHWCHVMAHESFEDESIANLMNRLFVNIKVDREERPDLDQIYQAAHAMLTRRSGGWPLTMFLTPDQVPFFGGTYFPKTARYGIAGFAELLPRIVAAYRDQGAAIAEQNARLREALSLTNPQSPKVDATLAPSTPALAYASLERSFDPVYGGFGAAPKFPHATELELCLRRYATHGEEKARDIVALTLRRMAEGGICDQLAGGFSRYSVDAEWSIPHFEKMLYDNALLLPLYADAWRVTGDRLFASTAQAIATWVLSEMRSPEGAFYSSLDADSEHEEGKFYVWTPEEVGAALSVDEYAVALRHWGLDRAPNFEHSKWHLRVVVPLLDIAAELGIDVETAEARLSSARSKLFDVRARRVRPGCDDKILTSWNALMIRGLARAARVFERPDWLAAARAATSFIRSRLWMDARLLATYKDARAHLNAYLDDHAFLLSALIELMQTDFDRSDLDWSIELAEALLSRFEDRPAGGFFFTSHDHEPLIHRPKPGRDNATPSGNGLAAQSLATLGHWLGETRYVEAAHATVRAFAEEMGREAAGYASLVLALEDVLAPPTTVTLRGEPAVCQQWHREIERVLRPAVRLLDLSDQNTLPGVLTNPHHETDSPATAWVCRGTTCLPPMHSLEDVEAALRRAT